MLTTAENAATIEAPAAGWKPAVHKGEARHDLSKQWIARPHDQRFLNLSDLRDFKLAAYQASAETVADNRKIEILAPENPTSRDDLNRLAVGLPDGNEVAPTNWAFGQLCGLAKAPAGYLKTLPSPIVADAVNYGLRYNRETEAVKLYHGHGELMAATGPDYGRIPDYEVVEAVMKIAGNGTGDAPWKVPGTLDWRTGIYDPRTPVTADSTTLFASDRDVFIFLVDDLHPIEVGKLPNGEPDLMFRGFYIQNSEVGSASLKLAAFYLRAVCCNRIMWGVEGFEEFSLRHSKYAPDRFIEIARPALNGFANGSTMKLLEGVEKAKAAKVADDDESALAFLNNRGLSRKRALAILETVEKEEGRKARTAWDFAQGITAAARDIQYQDERVTLENEARKILDKVA